ncbi:MAG: aminoglycoside phosphotransferase family protein [Alphaproteobacteria bacterium]|nr:aminoglycoside phosphotransferase family protein [Alphaproteobacteria bacterium]
MTAKIPPSEKSIIDCLKIHYGIEVAVLSLLQLGADVDASVYKAQTHSKHSYFVKLKRGNRLDTGAIIIELLRNARIQQVIPTIKTINGQEADINGFTLTLFPFIEGQDGFSRDLTNDHWHTLGKAMRQIHEINVPIEIQEKIRQESYSPKWREIVRSLYSLIEAEPSGDRVAINLLAFMQKHMVTIQRLVDRAEQLAQLAQNQELSQFVLCHSDLHGGNILIDKNDRLYIVDWDDPIMAPKERDLMFIGGGVANVWNKPHEAEFFYKGYGNADVNMTLLAYYRHERIVEDIAVYSQQLLLTTAGGQERENWYKHFTAQFAPQGVVEIAFETDKKLRI